MITRLLLAIPACAVFSLAQEATHTTPEPPPVKEAAAVQAKPSVIKLDENRYQIGGVVLDRKTREIRFPTKVQMTSGLIEYIFILQKGLIHETLLITQIVPTDLSLAMVLLRYTPSVELFSEINETGHPTGIYPEVPIPVRAAARISMEVEWSDKGIVRRIPLNDWLKDGSNSVLPPGPWLYTGSNFSEGKFIPDLSGNIASIKLDRNTMINYPGTDNMDGVTWYALPERIPPVGTDVTLIISPYFKPKPKALPTP